MADTSATSTIREIVDGVILMTRLDRDKDFFLLARHAMRGYQELRLFHLQERIIIKAIPDSLNRILYPSDCVKILKIYAPMNGLLSTLTRKDNLVDTVSGTPPNEFQDPAEGEGVEVAPFYITGLAVRGGQNADGYYKQDDERRTIFLNNLSRSDVFVEYISSGVSSSDSIVPAKAVRAIEMFVLWQYHTFIPSKLSEFYERQYEREVEMLRVLELPTLEELSDVLSRNSSQLPKR